MDWSGYQQGSLGEMCSQLTRRFRMDTDLYMKFFPKYYFLGLTKGALEKDVQIQQTIGWEDYSRGGAPGTFDPLAE